MNAPLQSMPLVKAGQGRAPADLLAVWPGLFRIGLVSLLIAVAVLAVHVVGKRNQSPATLAQLKSTSNHSTNN